MNLTTTEQKRRLAALGIVRVLKTETSIIAKPLASVNIKNIPDSAEPAIRNWIREHPGRHEVYGSGAMATHSVTARKPADLDIVIDRPEHAAYSIASILRRKGIKTNITSNPQFGSFVVQVKKNSELVDAIDIHPIKDHTKDYEFHGSSLPPHNKRGINIQRSADQLLRKANAITEIHEGGMGAAPKRNLKDTIDFITTAKLLVGSMQSRTEADRAKIRKVKENIKVWEAHLRTLKDEKSVKKLVDRTPISKSRNIKFVSASQALDADVDQLIFGKDDKVKVRTSNSNNKIKVNTKKKVRKIKNKKRFTKLTKRIKDLTY